MAKSNDLTISIKNMPEIKRALKKAGDKGREALRPAIEDAAKVLADAVRANARDGWIKSHVETKVVFDDEKGVTAIVGVERDADHPGNLALWFEYGTRSHKIPLSRGGEWTHRGMSAQPFMRPALDSSSAKAEQKIIEVLRRELNL